MWGLGDIGLVSPRYPRSVFGAVPGPWQGNPLITPVRKSIRCEVASSLENLYQQLTRLLFCIIFQLSSFDIRHFNYGLLQVASRC